MAVQCVVIDQEVAKNGGGSKLVLGGQRWAGGQSFRTAGGCSAFQARCDGWLNYSDGCQISTVS
eukprot:12481494-Alexandrium_andersonii.AAC.1